MQVTVVKSDLQKELALKLADSVENTERNMELTELVLTEWISDISVSLKKTDGN